MEDLKANRPRRRVAIVQSNYIPWKGYFDLINSVDECILYDDAQYTRQDWRNRNRIKSPEGTRWLTVPIAVSGRRFQRIRDAEIVDARWAAWHWNMLRRCYGALPGFLQFGDELAAVYARPFRFLTDLNRELLLAACGILGIRTPLTRSGDYELVPGRTERLVALCQQAGATEYVSGPSAQAYLENHRFADAGISVTYFDYAGYPEYPQLHGPFEHAVSILDLVFSTGAEAPRYMKSFGVRP